MTGSGPTAVREGGVEPLTSGAQLAAGASQRRGTCGAWADPGKKWGVASSDEQ
jgi:hypothetical protein